MRATIHAGFSGWWTSGRSMLEPRLAATWSWWTGEMEQLLPPRVRALLARQRSRIYLLPRDEHVVVLEGYPEQLSEIGQGSIDKPDELRSIAGNVDDDIVVLLPPRQILRKSIVLPAGVGEDLASALELEMDRQTPFTANSAYFDFSVRERSALKKTITVDVVLTPKSLLDGLLSSLSKAGIEPSAVTGLDEQGRVHSANLLPTDRRPARPKFFGPLNATLAALLIVLLVTAIAFPILEKRKAIASLEPAVAAAGESARQGSAIRSNIESLTNGTTALIDRKRSEPTTIRLLDEITRAIPDHTWIERIEIDEQEIQLRGQSPSAAELVALLESDEAFGDPQFRSPVTQVQNSNRERFHISVRWTGAER